MTTWYIISIVKNVLKHILPLMNILRILPFLLPICAKTQYMSAELFISVTTLGIKKSRSLRWKITLMLCYVNVSWNQYYWYSILSFKLANGKVEQIAVQASGLTRWPAADKTSGRAEAVLVELWDTSIWLVTISNNNLLYRTHLYEKLTK